MKWNKIKGYEGLYEVSETGIVRSIDRTLKQHDRNGNERICNYKGKILSMHQKIFKNKTNTLNRYEVALSKCGKIKTYSVHRLVAENFIPNPLNLETVNHKDGDTLNNNFKNLEWSTRADNIKHAFENKLIKTEKQVEQIDECGITINIYKSEADACRIMKVSQGKIGRSIRRNGTCKGFTWKYSNL